MKLNGINKLYLMLICTLFVGITGCAGINTYETLINYSGFQIVYEGSSELEKVDIQNEDVVYMYQEKSDSDFKDSLIVAEKYSQGQGVNTFVQENLNTLKDNGFNLSNINKTQIKIQKDKEKLDAVLVGYNIKGLDVNNVCIRQLFINENLHMILFSFVSDDQQSCNNVSNVFKNIKYKSDF